MSNERNGRTQRLNRRELLAGSAMIAGGGLVTGLGRAAGAAEKSPYGPFKMGLQSYTLRAFSFEDALKHTQDLGLHFWEGFAGQVPLTTDASKVSAILGKLKAADVKLLAHGVSGFGKDAAANRAIFEAARALGVKMISADPSPESYSQLNELVEEFDINIGIHNHGPGHRFDKLEQVLAAVDGKNIRFGACVDTGHFLRTPEDPVKVIKALGKRVHGVHLKDVKDAKTFTILGKGDMDVVGVLKALKELKFPGVMALEYEENPKDPIADIKECLAAVQAAIARI